MTSRSQPSRKKASRRQRLPGDPPFADEVARMIRVDHAGEFGAKRIYAGQLAVLGKGPKAPVLRHMAAQEDAHLDAFTKLMVEREVRPTVLSPLWHVAGFALGAVTAAMGEKAAMACTAAVEEAIDGHYAKQIEKLGADEPELKKLIAKFREEEIEHRDIALAHKAEDLPYYALLRAAIRAGSKTAIWLSERL